MKRPRSNPRSFLHQLAEPIPRAATPLLPHKSATNRGIPNQSALDLLPPILDVGETLANNVTTPPAHSLDPLPQERPGNSASLPPQTAQLHTAPTPSLRPSPASAVAAQPSRPARLVPPTPLPARPSETDHRPTAPQRTAQLEFTSPHSSSAQSSSSLASNHPATPPHSGNSKHERGIGTRIHIGTIEVRVPPSLTQNPQTAPVPRDAYSRIRQLTPRPPEPLARPLAWSQGLVQE